MESAAKINENMVKRLRLKDLPDELILKIFSMLPNFKESVATHLISKQHEDPYKLVSDVTLEDDNEESLVNVMSFVYGSLLSDEDKILQRLHLKLVRNYSASDINFWVQVAVNRSVRKLRIDLYGKTLVFPRCLSSYTTLKSLILRDVRIEVGPLVFCLPCLKSLHLSSVDFLHMESIASLLRGCPDLEYLVLYQISYAYWQFLNVRFCLSSLKSLHLLSAKYYTGGSHTLVLQRCRVLEYLVVTQAERFGDFWDIPPASCLSSVRVWRDESIATLFKRCAALEDLVITRTTNDNTLNIKDTVSNFIMLEFMPKVTKANIQNHNAPYNDPMNIWDEPAVVPECLLTHLEFFEWRQYENTVHERIVAAYILANATCLKMATFSTRKDRQVSHVSSWCPPDENTVASEIALKRNQRCEALKGFTGYHPSCRRKQPRNFCPPSMTPCLDSVSLHSGTY
ncbi:hypothetical protein Bca101_010915 [Brassica carinata]